MWHLHPCCSWILSVTQAPLDLLQYLRLLSSEDTPPRIPCPGSRQSRLAPEQAPVCATAGCRTSNLSLLGGRVRELYVRSVQRATPTISSICLNNFKPLGRKVFL